MKSDIQDKGAINAQKNKAINWAKQASDGDRHSERQLCQFLLERYKNYFIQQGYSVFAIEDATQEALISLIKSLRKKTIKDHGSINSYFHTAIKYQLWSYRRGRRLVNIDELPDESTSPDCFEQISNQEKLEHVAKSLPLLRKKRDRELITRHFFEEESIDSICGDFEMPKKHFYRVLYRARNRLSALM